MNDRTNAERQRRYIARLKQRAAGKPVSNVTNGPSVSNTELIAARQEIVRLAKELAALQAAPVTNGEIDRLRASAKVSDQELRMARNEIAMLRDEVARLQAKIVKPVKPPLDPESEAVRQIDALKKKNKTLNAEVIKWLNQVRSLVPAAVKAKVAKALHEQTTSAEARLDALQAWNGLGLNNIGKVKL